jgi:hypothetical protein
MKVHDLTGRALDWAVDRAVNINTPYSRWGRDYIPFSSDYNTRMPIVVQEKMLMEWNTYSEWWTVATWSDAMGMEVIERDPDLLVAAMRAFVTSKLGFEIEIPEQLK